MRAYKVELDLNDRQRTMLLQHAGAARWAYNYGLRRKIDARTTKQKAPTAIDLHKEIVILKHSTTPWLEEVSKCAPQQALRNLDVAFKNFFKRCKDKAKRKGFPKFKSRKRGIGSFTLEGAVSATDRTVSLPRIGDLRLKERGYVPADVKIKSVVVSERAGRWFVSVRTVEDFPERQSGAEVLGIDVGISQLAVLSDGTRFENPRALRGSEHRLRLLQKSVSRKKKGSSNRKKAVARVARQHYRVACIRSDAIHKMTSVITKRASLIGIETLNVAGMLKNHCLAKSLADASLSEIHRQITYKAEWSRIPVVKADRFFPSSKMCSGCGVVEDELDLSTRVFVCSACGLEIDRDWNAAINLKNLAVSSTVTACRPGSSGSDRKVRTKLLVGQEPKTRLDVVLYG